MASLRSLTGAFRALAMPSGASSSRVALQPARFAPLRPSLAPPHLAMPDAVRCASNLAPRRTKYRKAHKGVSAKTRRRALPALTLLQRVPIPIGGSLKGTTLAEGAYGLRLLAPARLSAKQLTSAETALKRKLKIIKGAQVFMRVFPDIPVCVKGNETRMGKGKGTFEFWACR
jgi:ribosomal protein L16